MILPKLAALFSPDVRSRGDAYFAQGRVRIVNASARAIEAVVRGTHKYAVMIAVDGKHIYAGCTCPYALDVGACKHTWAVLRHTESTGTLSPILANAGPKPIFMFESGSDDFGDAELYDDPDADLYDEPELDYPNLTSPADRATTWRPPAPRMLQPKPNSNKSSRRPPPPPIWKRLLDAAQQQMRYAVPVPLHLPEAWPGDRRLVYVVDLDATGHSNGIVVDVATEKRRKDGSWNEPKRFALGAHVWLAAPDPVDRQIAQMLLGAGPASPYAGVRTSGFVVPSRALDTTLRLICDTGRCRARSLGQILPDDFRWDGGTPWQFRLRVMLQRDGARMLTGVLRRGDEEMSLADPVLVHRDGFLVTPATAARFEHAGAFALVETLRANPVVPLAGADLADVLDAVHALPVAPAVELPADAGVREAHADPAPCVSIGRDPEPWRSRGAASLLTLHFLYESLRIDAADRRATVFDRAAGVLHYRQLDREAAASAKLATLGVKEEWEYGAGRKRLIVPHKRLAALVLELLRAGWHVDAEGSLFRAPGATRAAVRSGLDWFDLDAAVRYGDVDVPLPVLLEAHRRGEQAVTLADGTLGLLPTEWLARLGAVAAGGENANGVTRFRKSQVALLDALLAALPEVDADTAFQHARDELRRFDRVGPASAPVTFAGTLREYQREGLGWLNFLRRFGLGGCLADDMGLGKTVQVLALLEARRLEGAGPSLVVVPRSLVFNWVQEAERFTPALRVMDYSGVGRKPAGIDPTAVDVVLTTYGTLRRDAPELAGIEFDYAILDEAQAIKNAGTASAKAARLLRARHRLALSGTPIENRIDELWSLFEFLNPGMLGASSRFSTLARTASPAATPAAGPDPSAAGSAAVAGRELLARALRPVILRRTKDKVAADLPRRMEQTLEVELEAPQRKFYEAVRAEYRESVLARVERDGIKRARMHILEALLRLRQAACHPVLADARRSALPSAKLDALMPAIGEVVAEGHKALVFSQFTAFLALVRERVEKADIPYEYLDGKVRDRQARVERFQRDASCPLFLISLKAGGHGLNLTAADYVFILDPWWNPAVEAQAIDRAHRIGQARRVIATRLVARQTIEEKILELQTSKRSLADAILAADQGVLAAIGRVELELLLG